MRLSAPHDSAPALLQPRRSPLAFFGLVLAISVPFWLVGAATAIQPTPDLPISSFVCVCPMVAASILAFREGSVAGVAALLRRSFDHDRVRDTRWYIPAVLLLPGVYTTTYLVMRTMGLPLPSSHFPLLAALAWFFAYFVAGQCEELGWSGYALDPLQERWTALGASLMLGAHG